MGEERREVLEALSDKTRYAILLSLSKKPLTGDEIAEAVQRTRSTVEVHLAMLLRLGLVSRRREEKRYYYETTAAANEWLGRIGPQNSVQQNLPQPIAKKHDLNRLWLQVALLAGVAYAVLHFALNRSGLVSYSFIPFAMILGVAYAWINITVKEFLEALFIVSVTIGILSPIFAFGSLSFAEWLAFFLLYLAVLIVLSLPTWIVVKKARIFLKK